jgi:hypothetical protein
MWSWKVENDTDQWHRAENPERDVPKICPADFDEADFDFDEGAKTIQEGKSIFEFLLLGQSHQTCLTSCKMLTEMHHRFRRKTPNHKFLEKEFSD